MLDRVIAFSLKNRLLVLAATIVLVLLGAAAAKSLPIDVFPDLNRPTVTIMTEAPGLAPEEVETLVTFPLESSLNGASGVQRVRSASSVGLSIVWVEFDWGTDIHVDRQIVQEKLQLTTEALPSSVHPAMAPISSIMGEIMLLAVRSDGAKTPPVDLRTLADWTLRPRLLSVAGISQVTVIGGVVKQYQVITSPERLAQYDVTLEQLSKAVEQANVNAGGGFLLRETKEHLIRIAGRVETKEQLEESVVAWHSKLPVLVKHVASVRFDGPVKRGDGTVDGRPAVILSVQKQPNADTVALTKKIDTALDELQARLPADVKIEREIFRQSEFIEPAIANVIDAVRDGAILVLLVIFVFLWNLRTSFITIVAIPTSLVITAIVFKLFGASVNTMTLGGIAVAIGELVDDSIVDVENIFRRLKENNHAAAPRPTLSVIYDASCEVRHSIVYATLIVILVVLPLFALNGLEGRMFAPLATSYLVSLSASLVVSLTVTPSLASILLPGASFLEEKEDAFLVRWLKRGDEKLVRFTLRHPWKIILAAVVLVAIALNAFRYMGGSFLPPFNEGTFTVTVIADPGTSLEESNRLGVLAEKLIHDIPEVVSTARRTGRAELDEHAEGVNYSEIDVRLVRGRDRSLIEGDLRARVGRIEGVSVDVGQPISHRLDHMLSGVSKQVAVKVFGSDLASLRNHAQEIRDAAAKVPGVVDLQVEPQVEIPQVLVKIKRREAARFGLKVDDIAQALETALHGRRVSEVLEAQRRFDLVVWYDEKSRNDVSVIRGTWLDTPSGARVALGDVAEVIETSGPNTINRENVARRIVVSCNVRGRDLATTVSEIRAVVTRDVQPKLEAGTFVEYGGQFESQQGATRTILLLSILSTLGVFLLLTKALESWRAALQCMANVPLAAVGGVIAVYLTDRTLSVASLVGFITLTGIVVRNGIMMISHYVHLMRHEGEKFDEHMIVRGSLERLSPVLMTALAAVIGLVPLALGAGETGKEILHPLAIVVIGGLVSSTLLDQVVTPALFFKFGRKVYEHAGEAATTAVGEIP